MERQGYQLFPRQGSGGSASAITCVTSEAVQGWKLPAEGSTQDPGMMEKACVQCSFTSHTHTRFSNQAYMCKLPLFGRNDVG